MTALDSRRNLKSGIDKDDCRKNRAQAKVELRKAKRDESLLKRRNLVVMPTTDGVEEPEVDLDPSSIPAMAARVLEFVSLNGPPEGLEVCLADVKALRKMLSIANCPPIDDVINANLVPAFVTMLGHPNDQMQFETAWCLTNIASGTAAQCATVVQHQAVPPLVALLGSPSIEVSEQAVWALGNIAGDCSKLRDLVLSNGALKAIISLIEATASMGQMVPLRNAVWALSNMVRGKPAPAQRFVQATLPVLARLLQFDDQELLIDVCWALSYVTDGDNEIIDLVVKAQCVPNLLKLVQQGVGKLMTPSLRALCNIVTGSDMATQAVLDAGFLSVLPRALSSNKMQTRKEVCWALSNVTAGTAEQVDAVLEQGSLMAIIIEKLDSDEYEVKKEAAWVVANVLQGYKTSPGPASLQRVNKLVQLGCIRPMARMLDGKDATVLKLMLEAIDNLFSAGEQLSKGSVNAFAVPFDEAEGIDKLENLQEHENEGVYSSAVDLLEKYFGEDDTEDQNLAPNACQGGFHFGMQSNGPLSPLQPAFAF